MIHAINFATDGSNGTKNLVDRRNWQSEQMSKYPSVSSITPYDPYDIPEIYKQVYPSILLAQRGAGYWWWKPYIILNTMHNVPEGDTVFYIDADIAVNDDPLVFTREIDSIKNIAVIDNALPCYRYTKRDCFIMMDADTEEWHNSSQAWAAALAFKNNSYTRGFVTNWLVCCSNAHLIDDSPSFMGDELPGFAQHRWDQSIMDILLKKYKVPMLRNSRADMFAHPPW